jgi:hypothetical protein
MNTLSPEANLETLIGELVSLIEGLGTPIKAAIKAAQTTAIVNLAGGANVALDLTPIVQGAPEILFNLPLSASTTTTLSIVNPPASGVLAEFVLVAKNSAGSGLIFPSTFRWPQGIVPSACGVAGKLDTFVIYTQDGGASFDAFVAGQSQ